MRRAYARRGEPRHLLFDKSEWLGQKREPAYSERRRACRRKGHTMSGIITAVVEETFEPLHTGGSLVFTIAPNGKVWGKRLDGQSGNKDIELEIFWPDPCACLVRQKSWRDPERLDRAYHRANLTISQRQKIGTILNQKEKIQDVLGTVMVSATNRPTWSLPGNYIRDARWHNCKLSTSKLCQSISVVDCTYGKTAQLISSLGLVSIRYDDSKCAFRFSVVTPAAYPWKEKTSGNRLHQIEGYIDTLFDLNKVVCFYERKDDELPYVAFWASQAEDKEFLMPQGCPYGSTKPTIRAMYNENNFFDLFDVDDALLLLEEKRLTDSQFELHWTFCIAQNRLARNLARLNSNNSTLFETIRRKG